MVGSPDLRASRSKQAVPFSYGGAILRGQLEDLSLSRDPTHPESVAL